MTDDTNKNLQHVLLVDALIKDKKELEDAERIYDNVRELQFLKNLFSSGETQETEEDAIELCHHMKYEKYRMGTFVFKEKDESNGKFYVILSGEVGVIINANLKNVYEKDYAENATMKRLSLTVTDSFSVQIKERTTISSGLTDIQGTEKKISMIKLVPVLSDISAVTKKLLSTREISKTLVNKAKKNTNNEEANKEDYAHNFEKVVQRSGFGELRHILTKGNYFGDAALKEPGALRTASILCKTDCEFLIIDHYTFNYFVKKGQQKKTDFLWKSFSFLAGVSSSQVKNLIFYSFKSTGFSEGNVVTVEGAPATTPIFYVVESGECKVEKKMNVDVRHPFNKELIRKEHRWVTICHIASGTIIGEEILLQPDGQEVYEYKVTVTSKKASMFWIEKNVFLGIHPALEEQLRVFYNVKKKKRESIFDEIVREYKETILKYFTHDKNPFLTEYGMGAKMLNGSSLNHLSKKATSKRSVINSSLSPRSLNIKPSESDIKTTESPRSFISRKDLSISRSNLYFQPALSTRSDYVSANLSPTPQNSSLKISKANTISVKGTSSDQTTQFNLPKQQKTSDFSWYQSGRITETVETDEKKNENQNESDPEKNLGLILEKIEKEETILSQLKHRSKKKEKEYNIIRKNKKAISDLFAETIREPTEAVARMAFIDQFEIPEHRPLIPEDIQNQKFVFHLGISSRNDEITKMKTLSHGIFASNRPFNYLKNQHNLAEFVENKIVEHKLLTQSKSARDAIIVKATAQKESATNEARELYSRERTLSSPSLLKGPTFKAPYFKVESPLESNTLANLSKMLNINVEDSTRAHPNTSTGSPDSYRHLLSAKHSVSGVSMDASLRVIHTRPQTKAGSLHQKRESFDSQQTNNSSIYQNLLQTSENKKKLSRSRFRSQNKLQKLITAPVNLENNPFHQSPYITSVNKNLH